MASKTYSVTLDEETVAEAQRRCSDYGGKLSPLLNKLLKSWLDTHKKTNGDKPKPKDDKKEKSAEDKVFDDSEFFNKEELIA